MAALAGLAAAGAGGGGILAGLGTAISAASSVVGALGAIQQGRAAQQAAEYNARVAERDAAVVERNALMARRQAEVAGEDKRRANRRILSSVRTAYAANGVSMAGSPLDVMFDTAAELELDAAREEYEGTARASEGGMEALGLTERAQLSRMEGASRRRAGVLSAFGILTSGVGGALSNFARMRSLRGTDSSRYDPAVIRDHNLARMT